MQLSSSVAAQATVPSTPTFALAAAGSVALANGLASINAAIPLVHQLEGLSFEEFDRVELEARRHTGAASTAVRTGAELLLQALPDQSVLAGRLTEHADFLARATHILARHDSLPNVEKYGNAIADVSVAQALLGALADPYPYPYPYSSPGAQPTAPR